MNTFSSVLFVKTTLRQVSKFMEELKSARANELQSSLTLLKSRDISVIKNCILSLTSFFLIEAKLNSIVEAYQSLDQLWKIYLDSLQSSFTEFCLAKSHTQILEYKKILHFSSVVFR